MTTAVWVTLVGSFLFSRYQHSSDRDAPRHEACYCPRLNRRQMSATGGFRGSQQGMALLTVLLLLAFITVLATEMSRENQMALRRTQNNKDYQQAYWYAMSSEALAKGVLKQDFEDSPDSVHLQQYWATADVVYPVDKGQISGAIDDMRACFNLNALVLGLSEEEKRVNPYQRPLPSRQFVAMLVALGVDNFWAESMADKLRDFIDENDNQDGAFGAEDAEYEARPFPYRTPNQLMFHHSDFRSVLSSSQESYDVLKDFLCAIPGDRRQVLNVNTLPTERAALLVGMLDGQLSLGEAEAILQSRPADGWSTAEQFWETPSLRSVNVSNEVRSTVSVESDYFRLRGAAMVNNAVFRLESVLKRGDDDNLTVLTRQFGGQQ